MAYDELMKTITLNRPYPIENGPMLQTRKNLKGQRYEFRAEYIRFVSRKTLEVLGRDEHQVWGNLSYELKSVPKWLKEQLRGLRP